MEYTVLLRETTRCRGIEIRFLRLKAVCCMKRVYATHEFSAEKKFLISFVPTRVESDKKEKMWVGGLLLLHRCAVEGIRTAKKWHLYSL